MSSPSLEKEKTTHTVEATQSSVTLEKIVALCKRRGFVYPTADIYSGLNGVYDFGPLGAQMRLNIKEAWRTSLTRYPEDVLFFDGAQLGSEAMWKASGHLDNFSDPMVDCLNCKKRFRADELDLEKGCQSCGVKNWTDVRQFQLMFQTQLGALADATSVAYLRPETAQSIFVNFKNIMSSNRVKIPFGVAQIGKAFRNEITPKQFLFRMREFEQMELEFFCHPDESDKYFELWRERRRDFYDSLGLNKERVRLRPHESDELAHYSKCCDDVEYNFPFGWKELEGIAHRSDYDLSQHTKHSGKDLVVFDEQTKQSYTPHVVECSVGVDRLFLTLLFDGYKEDVIDGEARTVLSLHPSVAPVKVAVLSLTNKLNEQTQKLYTDLKKTGLSMQFDAGGSIGKRYRRQDEIGTPLCVTYDFDSENDQAVTVRDRDTCKQERVAIDQLEGYIKERVGC
ncbi:MAG: glycine--tRNA ligase [Epsilonproteobacteria bacterium]|nr:glycine--tRNA ligase [Campylobacterota bacterium]